MSDALKVHVHLLRDAAPGAVGPVLATFPQGPPAESAWSSGSSSAAASEDRITLKYLKSTDDRKVAQRMVAGGNDLLKYEGKNFGDDAPKGVYRYAVAVINRKRKRMDLYEAEAGGAVFGVQLTGVTGAQGDAAADLEGVTAKARRDMLIDAFGSRKKKAMERSKAANIVDVSAVSAAEDVARHLRVSAAAADGSGSGSGSGSGGGAGAGSDEADAEGGQPMGRSARAVEATLREARVAMLPPYNPLATTPSDVYLVDGLLGSAAGAIEPAVAAFVKALKDSVKLHALIHSFARDSEYLRDRLGAVTVGRFSSSSGSGGGQGGEEEGGSSSSSSSGITVSAAMRKKLRCLVFLKHLLTLHKTRGELRPKLLTLTDRAGEGADGSTAAAAAAAAEGTDDAAAAAAAAVPSATTIIAIPALKHIPAGITDRMLSLFAEQRADAGGARPARDGGASGAATAAAAASDGADSDAAVYVRTQQLQDKLVTWLACLSLVVDDFSADIRLLAADLKLTPARLLHFYKELGCQATPVRGSSSGGGAGGAGGGEADARGAVVSYHVKLTVPLMFPKLKMGRKQ